MGKNWYFARMRVCVCVCAAFALVCCLALMTAGCSAVEERRIWVKVCIYTDLPACIQLRSRIIIVHTEMKKNPSISFDCCHWQTHRYRFAVMVAAVTATTTTTTHHRNHLTRTLSVSIERYALVPFHAIAKNVEAKTTPTSTPNRRRRRKKRENTCANCNLWNIPEAEEIARHDKNHVLIENEIHAAASSEYIKRNSFSSSIHFHSFGFYSCSSSSQQSSESRSRHWRRRRRQRRRYRSLNSFLFTVCLLLQ